jgi:hypothetical protein
MVDKTWRPENWQQLKLKLADAPFVWSPSGPNVSHFEQLIEATASKILEEYQREVELVTCSPEKAEQFRQLNDDTIICKCGKPMYKVTFPDIGLCWSCEAGNSIGCGEYIVIEETQEVESGQTD